MRGSIAKDPAELEIGHPVWLYPNTKLASHSVHRQLKGEVLKDPKAHWPMLVIGTSGNTRWELIHKDNVSLKPIAPPKTQDKKQGDQIGGDDHQPTKVRTMGPVKPNLDGQGTLF